MDRIRGGLVVTMLGALALAACTTTSPTTTTQRPTTTVTVPTTSAEATTPANLKIFVAALKPVNKSGVMGEAVVIQRGSTLYVQIRARGMVPNQEHAQHIHGLSGSKASTCPPSITGTVTQEAQAERYYGQVLVPLAPFPTASASGTVTYQANVAASSDVPTITLLPLGGRAVVLHGMMVGGTYDPSVPVACGELRSMPGSMPPAGFTTTLPAGVGTGTTGGEETSEPLGSGESSRATP